MGVYVQLDTRTLSKFLVKYGDDLVKTIVDAAQSLADAMYAHIVEKVQNDKNLSDTHKKIYLEATQKPTSLVSYSSAGVVGEWKIVLGGSAESMEKGGDAEPYDMKPGLLKNGKTSASGVRYRVVPFNQNKTTNQMSSGSAGFDTANKNLLESALKKEGSSIGKLVDVAPGRSPNRIEKDGRKTYKVGEISVSPSYKGSNWTSEILSKVNIYQTESKNAGGKMSKSFKTFRTVTDQTNQKNKWWHPAFKAGKGGDDQDGGLRLHEEVQNWASQQWDKFLDDAMQKFKG